MKAKVYRFPNRLLSPDKGWVLRCEFRSPNLGDGIFVANNRALIDTGASHCAISFKIWREITDTFSHCSWFKPDQVGQEPMAGITGGTRLYPVHVLPKVSIVAPWTNNVPATLLEITDFRVIVVGNSNFPFIIGRPFLNCGILTLNPFTNEMLFETTHESISKRPLPSQSGYFENMLLGTV